MGKKTVKFKPQDIEQLPKDKPVVYKILSKSGTNNYTGSSQKGQVRNRLIDHLPGGKDHVPGSKVQVEQMNSIAEAREKETRIIARSKPRFNKKGK